MRRGFRPTIAALMGLVFFVAAGLGVLIGASRFTAGALFTGTIAAVGAATLGAAFLRGERRAFCAGVALFGGGYLVLCFGPWCAEQVRPALVTTWILEELHPEMTRPANDQYLDITTAAPAPGSPGQTVRVEGHALVDFDRDGNVDMVWGNNRRGWPGLKLVQTTPVEHYNRAGDCLWAIAAGVIGGLVARAFWRAGGGRERQDRGAAEGSGSATGPAGL